MSGWAIVVLLDFENTRAFARYPDPELALLAADFEPECRQAKDWVILGKGAPTTQLGPAERRGLLTQLGLTEHSQLIQRGLEGRSSRDRGEEERLIMEALLKFEPVRDRLSAEAEALRTGKRIDRAEDHRPRQETTDMGSKKSVKLKETTKAIKRAATEKSDKKAVKGGSLPARVGRDGTPAKFIREEILAGGENGKIAEKAAKKFNNEKITSAYVAWYRNKMRKDGLIKG